ncbi:MAG: M14 family zinc carboxypeptidase [Bacteroidales bacterium]
MSSLFVTIVSAGIFFLQGCEAPLQTPAESSGFEDITHYDQIISFCRNAADNSDLLEMEVFGQSAEGRDLVVMKANNDQTGQPGEEKLRILMFAQQHGNEQSGKEGSLLLIKDIVNGKFDHWFKEMELWIIPQVNPDGGEENRRTNAQGLDLNRDHVVQEAPETRALHSLFRQWMPHVTIDVHEYFPYSDSWADFGGYKQFDVQVGVTTNINIDQQVQHYSLTETLPWIERHLAAEGYTFHNYLVGPPPLEGITRHSTIDINDGRQGFGILNTMSFIYEGVNGRDRYVDQLEHRSRGQLEAMIAMMDFMQDNRDEVVFMVNDSREQLEQGKAGSTVAVKTDYIRSEEPLFMPLRSSSTGADTVVQVDNYHPLVEPVVVTERPLGYLISREDHQLMNWLSLHDIRIEAQLPDEVNIYAYQLTETETKNGEHPPKTQIHLNPEMNNFVYVPSAQLHGNFLSLTLEPHSDIALGRHQNFTHLLEGVTHYPVYRVETIE